MEALPAFTLIRPTTLDEVLEARRRHPDSRLIGGGTDILVNIRRGILAPGTLIDMTAVADLKSVTVDDGGLRLGASATIAEVAGDPAVAARYPAVAEAAGEIAGPTHREMGTVGGNLCLDTRCIYYNQSEWWRRSNSYCLKNRGEKCHVAPKSTRCFATFSGDLAPALLVHGATAEIAGPDGRREAPLADIYTGDGQRYLALESGEILVAVKAPPPPEGLRAAYDKVRVRRSIDFPLAGVAVALRREGEALAELRVAFTGTNPRPVLLEGTEALCGGPLDEALFERLDELVRDQIMSMKTTFTPGHYRRRVAGVLARRLVERLYAG